MTDADVDREVFDSIRRGIDTFPKILGSTPFYGAEKHRGAVIVSLIRLTDARRIQPTGDDTWSIM